MRLALLRVYAGMVLHSRILGIWISVEGRGRHDQDSAWTTERRGDAGQSTIRRFEIYGSKTTDAELIVMANPIKENTMSA